MPKHVRQVKSHGLLFKIQLEDETILLYLPSHMQ